MSAATDSDGSMGSDTFCAGNDGGGEIEGAGGELEAEGSQSGRVRGGAWWLRIRLVRGKRRKTKE